MVLTVPAIDEPSGWAPRGVPFIGYPRTYGKLAADTNVNAKTLLATDYLNHFNEVVMLLELTPSMPDCFEDVRDWQPLTYEEHFENGVLRERAFVIAAYDNAPPAARDPFDDTVAMIVDRLIEGLEEVRTLTTVDRLPLLANTVETITGEVRQLIDLASAIINAGDQALTQAAIDAVLTRSEETPNEGVAASKQQEVLDQSAIDALFD